MLRCIFMAQLPYEIGASTSSPRPVIPFDLEMIESQQKVSYRVELSKGKDGWIIAKCPAVKGAITQGKNVDEALRNIVEAISIVLADIFFNAAPPLLLNTRQCFSLCTSSKPFQLSNLSKPLTISSIVGVSLRAPGTLDFIGFLGFSNHPPKSSTSALENLSCFSVLPNLCLRFLFYHVTMVLVCFCRIKISYFYV